MEENVVQDIYQSIENIGLMKTIESFFGVGTIIELPFSEEAFNTEIEKLNLSVRSYNCLKKSGIERCRKSSSRNTIGQTVERSQFGKDE